MAFDVNAFYTLQLNPFLLNLSTDLGLYILTGLIGLAIFFFWRKMLVPSGLLVSFIGLLLLYNGVSWFISGIVIYLGVQIIFLSGGRR